MPTYAQPSHKVTIFGTNFGGAEEWSTGFFLGAPFTGPLDDPPTQAEADAIAAAWQTFFTATSSPISSRWQTVGVKVQLVGTNGQGDPNSTVFSYYGSAISGNGTGATHHPPQISCVVTLTTAKPRGYGSKGRMYLPGVGLGIGVDGRIDTSLMTSLLNNLKTFYDAVNDVAPVNGVQPSIVLQSAQTTGVPAHDALMSVITGFKVGNVYDTQRRRRNQLVETYQTRALA